MELEERVASAIRAQTGLVELRVPDLASIRDAAKRQRRRRAAFTAGGVVVATALALTAGLAEVSQDRTVPPVDRSEREDNAGVITVPDVRAEQVVLESSVRSSVTPGERLVASASTADREYDDSGKITLPLNMDEPARFEASCNGEPRLWFVALVEPGAKYISSDRCDAAQRFVYLDDPDYLSPLTVLRMFVTDEDPREFRRCFNYSPPGGCEDTEPRPRGGSSAEMTVAVYIEERGPLAVSMFGEEVHARATAFGSPYSLTGVAAAATGGRQLSFQAEQSPSERIAQATLRPTEHWGRCMEKAEPQEQQRCMPTVELLIDRRPVEDQIEGPFGGTAGWGPLPPGSEHLITFRITHGDPRNVDLGVLIYEEDR